MRNRFFIDYHHILHNVKHLDLSDLGLWVRKNLVPPKNHFWRKSVQLIPELTCECEKVCPGSFSGEIKQNSTLYRTAVVCILPHNVGIQLTTKSICRHLKQVMLSRVACIESCFKRWTWPARHNQIMGTVSDLKRSKRELIAENIFLRQQLIVLERQVVGPKLTQHDRRVLEVLASRIQGWREALVVVKPET